MSDLTIDPITKPFTATITPPGSKSLTNRALVLAALSDGVCELSNVLFADDTQVMLEGLKRIGFQLDIDQQACKVRVHGCGGLVGQTGMRLSGNSSQRDCVSDTGVSPVPAAPTRARRPCHETPVPRIPGQAQTRMSVPPIELSCGNSGTTIRFLSALCALGTGTFVLDGVARMR